MRKRAFLALVLAAIPLVACSSHGNEYLGKWQNIESEKDIFTVEREGDNFIIIKENGKFPAVLKDGMLQMTERMGIGYTYVKANDSLTMPKMWGGTIEYKRVK